ncbi:winged helix-turn-helix domain-containing protein [Vibrio harveyi]|uniref:winged helix-turn-helix domain-containing protein n=1 Tax=Vibrio harveyi TaxID=669 RepID=UPI00237E3C38|nr:winged helix-turn-helix domain-containing protein [Vibrio harveyi]HDM8055093.1 winged helix-turn-helix domain-containing protein [Vibrio harveyi]
MKNNNRIVLGKFTWDRTTHYLLPSLLSGKTEEQDTVKLTNKQKALLNCLVDAHPNTISNKEIIQQVWGYEHISQESLPQLINRTRRTLEDNDKSILINVPGVGYSLNFDVTEDEELTSEQRIEPKHDVLPILGMKAAHHQNLKSWRILFTALLIVTMFNLWNTASALYYKHDFEKVLSAAPYPETQRSDDGTITVTIDNHECIYHKDELLLECQ